MISSRGRVWSRTGVGDRRRRASGSPSKMTSHRTRKPAVSREFLHEDRGSSRRRLAEDSRKTGPNAIRDDHALRARQHPGDEPPTVQRVEPDLPGRAHDRGAFGPPDPPRADFRDEWRELSLPRVDENEEGHYLTAHHLLRTVVSSIPPGSA